VAAQYTASQEWDNRIFTIKFNTKSHFIQINVIIFPIAELIYLVILKEICIKKSRTGVLDFLPRMET